SRSEQRTGSKTQKQPLDRKSPIQVTYEPGKQGPSTGKRRGTHDDADPPGDDPRRAPSFLSASTTVEASGSLTRRSSSALCTHGVVNPSFLMYTTTRFSLPIRSSSISSNSSQVETATNADSVNASVNTSR